MIRAVVAISVLAALTGDPAMAQPPAPAHLLRQDRNSATLIDTAGAKRDGAVVTVTSMLLFAEPVKIGANAFYWNDTLDEFDCDAHQWRSRAANRRTLDRQTIQALNDPDASEDWTGVDAGSLTAAEEALVCKGVTGNLKPIADLTAFATAFTAAK